MRLSPAIRAALAAIPFLSSGVAAQQAPAKNAATPAAPPAGTAMAYGATNAAPASKWTPAASAGRQLTLADLLSWKGIRVPQLSNDGKWFAYILAPNEGDAEVVVRPTAADGKEWRFTAGDATAGGGRGAGASAPAGPPLTISGNGRWVAFLEYPAAAAREGTGRGGRASGGANTPTAAAAGATKLAVVDLNTGSKREFERVRNFRFAAEKSNWIVIHHSAPDAGGAATGTGTAAPAGGRGGAAGGTPAPTGTMLELVNLSATGATAFIGDVSEFAFDDSGDWLAYAISVPDQVGNGVQLHQLSTGIVRALDARKASYRRLAWGDSTDALAVLRTVSDTAGGDEEATVVAWRHIASSDPQSLEISAKTTGVTGGLVVSSDRAIEWGDGQKTLFFGLREPRPARPRQQGIGFTPPNPGGVAPGAGNTGQVAAAPQTDAEVPSLILWHWKDPRLQSQQQVQEQQDRAFSYLAAFSFASGRVAQIADGKMRDVVVGPKDTWGVGTDISAYEREQNIKGSAFRDLYAVNIATGERKPIQMKVPGAGGFGGGGRGGFGVSSFSPDNSQYAYYDAGDWKIYEFSRAAARSITTGVPAKFWNTEDDHNQVKPPINGALVGWSRDGKNVFVRDNWDVWRLPATGSGAVNITGNGLKEQIRYQARLLFDPKERSIDTDQPLFFKTYGEWSKKEGLSQVDPVKGGAKAISWEDAKVDYRRARDANVWVYSRQTVVKFPDWYSADGGLRNERRLTDANPQQKDVAWTPGARLVEYTCENGGGRHQAVLYLPAGYEQGKKYPMLTYIYEKLSQEFNVYSEPNATRYSNPSVFTSRGYAFLKPDIVYHVNDPGRSALWCVVPAVKAAIATGIADPARIGLQGHSWGGYQTAFITTQTKIFKTAIAGAPLTDMVSMAGSVYWNSGGSDNAIFIASQGRFTGGPNDVPEAYTRNSPQQFAQNLSNPLMILHDDRDGAVDFNQGITYYNHLRNLGKDVVLLEYVGENHGLTRPANQKDYALRMTEWFDTFLRDQPAPDWLKDGVPRLKMEEHLRERRPLVDPRAVATPPKIVP
ncbi:MAG TPA: prolyl oligopeptidase family serine peptidase [Gemmatimonadaceae bacterium]|nr:prolyl oligopeptidase family serine peptidase [Gemmatimonadaceae bacterium]